MVSLYHIQTVRFNPVLSNVQIRPLSTFQNRAVGLFGTYGWSGGGVKGLRAFVEASRLVLIDPVVEARFAATDADLDQLRQLGRNLAAAVR